MTNRLPANVLALGCVSLLMAMSSQMIHADELAPNVRGSGFGLRLALFTIGSVLGPLVATVVMVASSNDMRLVFWIAAVPALLSVAVLVLAVHEVRLEMS